jgi:hypothetical protein
MPFPRLFKHLSAWIFNLLLYLTNLCCCNSSISWKTLKIHQVFKGWLVYLYLFNYCTFLSTVPNIKLIQRSNPVHCKSHIFSCANFWKKICIADSVVHVLVLFNVNIIILDIQKVQKCIKVHTFKQTWLHITGFFRYSSQV